MNEGGACSVDGRIVGVKKLKQGTADPSARAQMKFLLGAMALPILALAGRMLGLWAPDGRTEKSIAVLMVFGILLFLLEILKANFRDLRNHYRKKQHGSK